MFIFFFQAEDGIRDGHVTGVQTCALPISNIRDTIEELKSRHVWVAGTDADGTEDYRQLDGQTPIALVIGNEGRGMSRLVKDSCDWTVRLPMKGHVSSLNASVATSLLLYEVYRKRHPFGE